MRMKLCIGKILLFVLLGYIPMAGSTQNLIPNGSFDDLKGKKPTLKPWKKINTVDYFVNTDRQKLRQVNTLKNDRNYILRAPRTGAAYVGMRIWPKYNEFLQVILPKPLEKGKAYLFEMYITPSKYSNCYLRTIGASFYDFRAPYNFREGKEDYPPQVEMYKSGGIKDTADWIRVNGVFIAKGGERFVTIGCFAARKGEKFKRKAFSFLKREAYYYIDDIALYELDSLGFPLMHNENMTDSLLLASDSTNDAFSVFEILDSTARTIYFAENSAKIEQESYLKLGTITEFLLENPKVNITIIGYSAPGEMDGNELKMSEKRVKAVFVFLNGNRVSKERITIKSEGTSCEYYKAGDPNRKYCRKVEVILSS